MRKQNALESVFWVLTAALSFATMGVCVKFGSRHFNSGELVFYRGVIGVLCMLVWAKTLGVSLKTTLPLMHLWRTTVGVISLSAWFYSLAHLNIATAMTLNYMSSIWLTAFIMLGALFVGRRVQTKHHGLQAPLVISVLAGFAGVLMVLRPAFEQGQELAGLVGLLSGFVAAFAYLQVTALARLDEPEVRTVFYFAVGTVFMGLGSMAITGVSNWPGLYGASWLIPIGLLASLGQVCMTRAYSSGATLLVANLQYSGIVFSVFFGLFLFNDAIPFLSWAGMALIIASGITATILRHRANVRTATPEPAEEF
jgi:S-adenosylmethionine uptake transporter